MGGGYRMINAIVAATLSLAITASGVDGEMGESAFGVHASPYEPSVEVWASGDVFRRGDRVHVWFRSGEDAFITIFRLDTDGRVRVLYPRRPWHNNFVPGGRRLEVWDPTGQRERYAFVADDYAGQGYIFAVASPVPFDYGDFIRDDYWDYSAIAHYGRVTGDPYMALMDLIDHIVPAAGYERYSYDVYPYYIGRRYEYPRFLCYDCHTYVAYPTWDPYQQSCIRFRVVIYDDPYYYPARVYAGTRVVFTRPRRIEPRYVFKDRTASDPYVTKVRRRPANSTGRRVVPPKNNDDRRRVIPARPDVRRRATLSEDPQTRLRPKLERRPVKPKLKRKKPDSLAVKKRR